MNKLLSTISIGPEHMQKWNAIFVWTVLGYVASMDCAMGQLENATLTQIEIEANDFVYDSLRDRIYATVGSSAGFPKGNSIWIIDPNTTELIDTVFVGSEPNAIAISDDTSKVYVGLDGSLSWRCWEPATNVVGPMIPIVIDEQQNSRARQMVVRPGHPDTVVVLRSFGDLLLFRDRVLVDYFFTNAFDTISFSKSDYLFTYEHNTSNRLRKYQIVDDQLSLVSQSGLLITSSSLPTIESTGTRLFATNGDHVDIESFTGLDEFNFNSGVIEPIEKDQTLYFMNQDWRLQLFDSKNQKLMDSIKLFDDGSFLRQLVALGTDRLACRSDSGQIGIIENVPVSDELLTGDLNRDCVVDLLDVQPFVDALQSQQYLPLADINLDGKLDLIDIIPFVNLVQSD